MPKPNDLVDLEFDSELPDLEFDDAGTSAVDSSSVSTPSPELAFDSPESAMGKFWRVATDPVTKTLGLGSPSDFTEPAAKQLAYEGKPVQSFTAGIAGDLANVYSAPLSLATAGASRLVPVLGKTSAGFRRFLSYRTPVLSGKFLADNPMAPVYKVIQGIPRDITKPLPKAPELLVKQGKKLVDAVHETMDVLGDQYGKILEPSYKKVIQISDDLKEPLQKLGILDKDAVSKILDKSGKPIKQAVEVTLEDLWKGRWDLLKKVGNPWKKEELLKKTTLSEDEIMKYLGDMKNTVLNSLDPKAQAAIKQLDPQFSDAISAGKGLLRAIFDPETRRVNTTRLANIFKAAEDQGTRDLFNRFAAYDNRVNAIVKTVKGYNLKQKIIRGAEIGILGTAAAQYARWALRNIPNKIMGEE